MRNRVALALAAAIALGACTGADDTTTSAAPSATPSTIVSTTSSAPASTTATTPQTTSTAAPTTTTTTTSTTSPPQPVPPEDLEIVAFPVPAGSQPHDVAPALDGGVWYTAQASGELGWLDPASGQTVHYDLGTGSRPHGVIIDAEGAAWITDGGRNSIIKFDPDSQELFEYPLPADRPGVGLNTAAFDAAGLLWFTGQRGGIVGVLDPATGEMEVFDAPRGAGPYGIAATPLGAIYFASLAGSYVGLVGEEGEVMVLEPPTPDQGARRVWADSTGAVWVSEWNSGQLSRYQADAGSWETWPLPGTDPSAYAVYVDETDIVWVTDFGGNAIHRFDPVTETFFTFALPHERGNVRQLLGRPGEVWGAESRADHLVVIRRKTR